LEVFRLLIYMELCSRFETTVPDPEAEPDPAYATTKCVYPIYSLTYSFFSSIKIFVICFLTSPSPDEGALSFYLMAFLYVRFS